MKITLVCFLIWWSACGRLLAGTPAVSTPAQPPEDAAKFELFLLVGQSNMAGRGKIAAEDRNPDPRVFVLNSEDQWVCQGEPIHFDKPFAGTGLGFAFAKLAADYAPGVTVGLVPCAVGGTAIELWQPGQELYDNAVRRAKIAMRSGKLKGILWHQGESDSNKERAKDYGGKLVTMVAALRKDLNDPDLPFLAGELGDTFSVNNKWAQMVNVQIQDLPGKSTRVAVVPAVGLTCNPDNIHFNSESLKEFGKRYFELWKKTTFSAPAQ